MRILVTDEDDVEKCLELEGAVSVVEGETLNKLIEPSGAEWFFTKDGHFDGWGQQVQEIERTTNENCAVDPADGTQVDRSTRDRNSSNCLNCSTLHLQLAALTARAEAAEAQLYLLDTAIREGAIQNERATAAETTLAARDVAYESLQRAHIQAHEALRASERSLAVLHETHQKTLELQIAFRNSLEQSKKQDT